MSEASGQDDAEPELMLPAEQGAQLGAEIRRQIELAVQDSVPVHQQKQVVYRLVLAVLESFGSLRVIIVEKRHQGPIPSADTLREYDDILPGSADRIIRMAEKDQAAFIEMHADSARRDDRYRTLGLICGFVALSIIVCAAVYLVVEGHAGVIAVAGMGVAGIVGSFVTGNTVWRREEAE
jgi:uncharacterized membrane protein